MPDDLTIRDVVAKLRRAAAARQRLCRTTRFDFRMHWLKQQILATVDAGRSDPVLRHDIAYLMGAHQRDFDEGWRRPWLPDNTFYLACFEKPDGMKQWIEGFWPWEARRN